MAAMMMTTMTTGTTMMTTDHPAMPFDTAPIPSSEPQGLARDVAASHGTAAGTDPVAGFTLIEMVTVAAIFALIVGAGIPVTELYLRSKMLEATRNEMSVLGDATLNYYIDLEAFPTSLQDLVDPDPVPTGWMGPYLTSDFSDADDDSDDYRFDIWRNAYVLETVNTLERRLLSYGPNRTDNDRAGDDITLDIHAGPALATITRRELEIINNAIATYNSDFVLSNPLSTDFPTLLGQLQAAGYLPSDGVSTTRYTYDGWGQAYYTSGQVPVIEALSLGGS